MRGRLRVSLFALVLAVSISGLQGASAIGQSAGSSGPQVFKEVKRGESLPVSSLPQVSSSKSASAGSGASSASPARTLPLSAAPAGSKDPVVQRRPGKSPNPSPTTFEGIDYTGSDPLCCYPSDTNGDVGPNNYVQIVNDAFDIFNKSGGNLSGVVAINSLFTGFGGVCETTNDGDPIALYDPMADRWLISQFANVDSTGPYSECIAISKTANPTGAYWLYEFQSPITGRFPDYPKFGIWPDGYYMTVNEFDAPSFPFSGVGVYAFDRTSMLTGAAATDQYFHLGTSFEGLLPADLDGSNLPPGGAPEYITAYDASDDSSLHMWDFHVDWSTPSNSTLNQRADINVAPFNPTGMCPAGPDACVPQPGTAQRLDSLADRLMYRLSYRNFGTTAAMVVSHSVNAGGHSGVRWYQLYKANSAGTWSLEQQGTYAPDSTYRWMPSVAMDKTGDIGMVYSVSDATSVFPGIRVAGHLSSDAPGVVGASEVVAQPGGGSQTRSPGRWGDYAAMNVDPTDDCTFWFTTEYYATTALVAWKTRIGHYTYPSCGIRPDGEIALGSSFSGTNIYNNIALQTLSKKVVAGKAATFTVRIANQGDSSDDITVSGPAAGSGFTLTVTDGATNVTSAFTGGTFVKTVAAGSSADITVKVKAKSSAKVGKVQSELVSLVSGNDSSVVDSVLGKTTVKKG